MKLIIALSAVESWRKMIKEALLDISKGYVKVFFDDNPVDSIYSVDGITDDESGMKKSRSKIIIKTRAGGYTKIYANGKWQKKVCVIDYHAECSNKDGIKVSCEFDKNKTDKNGSVIYDPEKEEIVKEHVVARI